VSQADSTGRKIGTAALVVSAGIILSRVLGLLREVVLADQLGASGISDTYVVAFIIPDFLNYLLAGGYISITFIPLLSRHLAKGDVEGARRSFFRIATPVTAVLAALVLIGMALAEPVIDLVTELTPQQTSEAARLTRIVLPAQLFFVLGSLLMAIQYANEKFLFPSLAPVIYNLGIIGGGLLLTDQGQPSGEGFALGVLVGSLVGNFALQAYGAARAGLRMPHQLASSGEDLKQYLKLALPLMVGQSLVLLDESIGRVLGTRLGEGPATQLRYARQVMMAPVAAIGGAAAVAAFPYLSRMAAEGAFDKLGKTVARAGRSVAVLGLVAAGPLVALSIPVVGLLFDRGAFAANPANTSATAAALAFYALGIPFWALQSQYSRGFYALREMWTPVLVGTAATVVAIPLSVWLGNAYGVKGLAAASTLSIAGYTAALGLLWYRRTGPVHRLEVLGGVGRAFPLVLTAAAAAWLAGRWLASVLGEGWLDNLAIVVGGGIAFLAVVAIGAAWLAKRPPPLQD